MTELDCWQDEWPARAAISQQLILKQHGPLTLLNTAQLMEDLCQMRERKSARLLVINPNQQVLLFRFIHKDGPLVGDDYWATPGGGLEEGETFHMAAVRELREETGIQVNAVGDSVASRQFPLQLPSGEWVSAVEQYFVVHVPDQALSRAEWTLQETQVMAEHHWWSAHELRTTELTVWPEGLIEMLVEAGVFNPAL